MLTRIFRLVDTKRIEMNLREVEIDKDTVLVKPEYMSICAADQRYYLGKRKRQVLTQKLPMALIHEAYGVVLHDFSGNLKKGSHIAMFPLEYDGESDIKANYQSESKFKSSGIDGFMRDLVTLKYGQYVELSGNPQLSLVFAELISVAVNAIETLHQYCEPGAKPTFGVWGDGSVGFAMAIVLRSFYPAATIYVFGKTIRKLIKFSFADKTFFIDNVSDQLKIDHCFECVGDKSSESAILQMMQFVRPQGSINLLGVSEEPISLDTRTVLEKGLIILGNNRSDINDFRKAVNLIENNECCKKYLHLIISQIIDIKSESDISHAFEQDVLNDFKTILKWSI